METDRNTLLRRFFIQLALNGVLVFIYLILVLRLLSDSIVDLFYANPFVYAIAALILVIAQGLLLEVISAYLLERLGLE